MIEKIIDYIDKYVDLSVKSNGLCVLVNQNDINYPAKPKGNDYELICNLDKLNDFYYWRQAGEVSIEEAQNTYSSKKIYNITYPCKIIYCKKRESKDVGYIDSLAISTFSLFKNLKKINKDELEVNNIFVNVKSYNTLIDDIINDEFGDIKINPNHVFISFNIEIVVTVDSNCLSKCI